MRQGSGERRWRLELGCGRGCGEGWLDSRVAHFVIRSTSCLSSICSLRGPVLQSMSIKNESSDKYSSAPNQVKCTGSSRLTRGDAPRVRISATPGR